MQRSGAVVVASMLMMLLGVEYAGRQAHAQPAVPGQPRPYFYLWGIPANGASDPLFTSYASQMVRVYANQGAAAAALDAAIEQEQLINTGLTDPGHTCIVLQNFGQYAPSIDPYSSFLHAADAISPAPVWDPIPQPDSPLLYIQPWIVNGRVQADLWMNIFLTNYDAERVARNLPAPARFHFDTELYLAGCCSLNHVRILAAASLDSRWHQELVPGSKDYLLPSTGDKTMAEMYEEAKLVFDDWDDLPLYHPTLPHALNFDEDSQDDQNRRYTLWYAEICQRAVDAALNESAYSQIKAQYPACKVSNYEHADMDGHTDTFGWYTGRADTGAPVTHGAPPTLQPMRQCIRGATSLGPSGEWYYWSDFVDTTRDRPSLWFTSGAATSGDFSAPVLYPPNPQHNPKDPKRNNHPNRPTTDRGHIAHHNRRRAVESVHGTGERVALEVNVNSNTFETSKPIGDALALERIFRIRFHADAVNFYIGVLPNIQSKRKSHRN